LPDKAFIIDLIDRVKGKSVRMVIDQADWDYHRIIQALEEMIGA
jgi:phosphoribosylaminoimidazole (AIR) synthetase